MSLLSLVLSLIESIKREGVLIMHLALGSLQACHSMTNEDCSPMTRENADNIMQVTAKSMLSSFYYLSPVIRLILWKEESHRSRWNPVDGGVGVCILFKKIFF